jgi:hypothetical protein
MCDAKKIESLVLDKFSFLQDEFGMGKPILNRDTWNTTISYLSKEIGIEIELGWRDLDVFILITKLDNGKLPKGYYVVDGKTCRVHLEEVLKSNLNFDKTQIQDLVKSDKKKKRKKNQESMIERTESYQHLLQNYVGAILKIGESLF